MEFGILGRTEVTEAGREAYLGGPRPRALLALLALHANQPVPTEQLVEELWDGDPPAGATATLHSHVRAVRRVVGTDRLRTRAGGYELVVGEDELDARMFEIEAAAARSALARGETSAAAQALVRALSRWRGPALADAAGAAWATVEAARLEELRAAAEEALLEARLALGEDAEVAAMAEAAVAEHPLRERLSALWMRALYRSGRQADALHAYQRLRTRLREELGIDPSEELAALERAILKHDPSLGGSRMVAPSIEAQPLPEAATSFVGRDAELGRLASHLAAGRLVTVTGPGGVGKTRLALEAARRVGMGYVDGVFLCDLAAVTVGNAVPDALASVLRVQQQADRTVVDRLVEFLRSKHALLVIDNCEHVIDAVAATVEQLMTRTSADILATSREPLCVAGEQRMPIEPLPVPDADKEDDAEVASVRLFADRTAAVQPSFALDASTLPVVSELCRRMDGLPLAIELASARIAVRTPEEVLRDLSDRPDALVGGRRTDHARHRSMQAVIGWSYDLLPDEQRRLYEELSVFAGGFTTDAAAVIHDVPIGVVTDLLEALVLKSLVMARAVGNTTRYRLLEPIRRDAEERLKRRRGFDATRLRHARWAVGFAEAADAGLRTAAEPAWASRLGTELSNLRAAHLWSLTAGDADVALRLSAALYWYASSTGLSEVFAWAERAATRFDASAHPLLATVLASAAIGAWRRGDVPRTRALVERGIEAASGHDPACARLALQVLGDVGILEGDWSAAVDAYRRAVALGRARGDTLQTVTELAAVAAGAPAELRRGPRGGGRDRDAVVAHVVDAERSYARKLGVRLTAAEWREGHVVLLRERLREALVGAAGERAESGWPPRYLARRTAWHVLDHAWEIEDRSS